MTMIEHHRFDVSEPSRVSQDLALIGLFERLATDPRIPLDRIETLMKMQRTMLADRARSAFIVDMARLQPLLPTVEQNGRLVITDKNDRTKIIQSTSYAKWEDINEAIRGPLGECGFALTFRAERKLDQVIITGILSHREGHQETTELSLALDTGGSKNNVQAVGSSVSYGKRYTAGMLLNITSRMAPEADDDGKNAGEAENYTVSDEQIEQIKERLVSTKSDEKKFLAVLKIPSLSHLLADKFDDTMTLIADTAQRRIEREKTR